MDQTQSPFASFFMGGFECSTKKFWDGRRIDVIGKTKHDLRAREDYELLNRVNVKTVRDGMRWHLIEQAPGRYDWSSWQPLVEAALETNTQVAWDLCHYGMPDWLTDPFSPDMPDRFGDFAQAAAEQFRRIAGEALPLWSPINEISFWGWGAGVGERPFMWPSAPDRGADWKRALCRAAIVASTRVRAVDPRARLLHIDPIFHITTTQGDTCASRAATESAMYEAWDMISGRMAPELGGSLDLLDIVGCNFYSNNEWQLDPPSPTIELGSRHYRPLNSILCEVASRYGRPLFVSETGAEGANGPAWMAAMGYEVREALREGVPVWGLCIYPVIDYSGWDNDRHCRTGLISLAEGFLNPSYDKTMLESLLEQQRLMDAMPQLAMTVNALTLAAQDVKVA